MLYFLHLPHFFQFIYSVCCNVLGGTIVLFDRKKLRNFRKDGHNWKKKKDGKTIKEAHEHLKVRTLFTCMNGVAEKVISHIHRQ